jgi:AraC family transcriptional regulator
MGATGITWIREGSNVAEPIPGLTVASQARWGRLRVEESSAGPGELPEGCLGGHLLALNVGRPCRVELAWSGAASPSRSILMPGNFNLLPAAMPFSARWEDPGSVVMVEIAPETEPPRLQPLVNHRDPFVSQLVLALRELLRQVPPTTAAYGDTLASVLVQRLVSDHEEPSSALHETQPGLPPDRLRRIFAFIEANIERDITLEELAEADGTSVFHFARLFKRRTGVAPHQYVLQRRIDRARSLLTDPRLSIGEVASRCGFAHQSHFSDAFRRAMGMTATVYRTLR